MAKPTIRDVADLAGVSKATVSAVLNDKDTVRTSTREQVLEAIRELNYRPSASARRRFRPAGSKSVGFVIKEIENPYYTETIAGAKDYLNEHGYRILVATSEGDYQSEHHVVDLLKSKEVDGLILTPVLDRQTDLSHIFELKRRNFPFVLLEDIHGVRADLVDVDNALGAQKAVEHLISLGHSRIVHFAGPVYSQHSEERIGGVRRAFSESRLAFSADRIVSVGAHLRDGYRVGLEYFRDRSADRPTAVTCYNDLVALGLCRALDELGLRVPEDISVVGYDDLDLLDFVSPRLTTVRVPKREMGRVAAEMLIEAVEARSPGAPRTVHLDAELVVRGSTRPPA